jgi:hypothetical protein
MKEMFIFDSLFPLYGPIILSILYLNLQSMVNTVKTALLPYQNGSPAGRNSLNLPICVRVNYHQPFVYLDISENIYGSNNRLVERITLHYLALVHLLQIVGWFVNEVLVENVEGNVSYLL